MTTSFGRGPYYAQFEIKSGRFDVDWFVVEISSKHDLPHSVYTFLAMMEAKLFDGTVFVSHYSSANTDHQVLRMERGKAKLTRRYKALGYDEAALSFLETSDAFPCQQYSMGFAGRGPALEFYMTDDDVGRNKSEQSCLGRVTRGMGALGKVQAAIREGKTIEIVQVRHLKMNDETDENDASNSNGGEGRGEIHP